MLDDLLVSHRASGIQHDDDEVTSAGDCNDLLTSALAILGSLDNSRQIQQLYFSTLMS